MTLTITIDGVDVTDKVRLEDMRLEMAAVQGQVGSGRITIDDDTGAADLAPAAKEWSATESDATPTTIAGGFIAERRIDRGPLVAGVQRQYEPVMEDWNTTFTDRVFKGSLSKRPAETDYQRISWLLSMSALAQIDGAGHVPNAATVDMPKTNYLGKTPLDVLDDCAEASNKNYYMYYKSGTGWVLYYDVVASTEAAFTSTLKISDDLSDVDSSTVFAPSKVSWEQDPERVYSSIFVQYDGGQMQRVNSATETTYRRLQRSVVKKNFTTAKRARTWADNQLSKLDEETKKLDVTISVPGSALGQLRAGMRIQVKLRSRGVTAYTYFRIASTTFSYRKGDRGESDVMYDVRLKMRDKIRPVNLDDDYGGGDSSGNGGTGSNPPGGVGGGSDGGGGTSDVTPYVMDDFNRVGSFAVIGTAEGVSHVYSEGDTTATVSIPADWDATEGNYLLVLLHEAGDSDVQTEMEAVGFSKVAAASGSDVYYRRILGTESWSAESFSLFFSGESVELGAVSLLVSGIYEELPSNPGLWYSYDTSVNADPDGLSAPSWAGEPAIFITACRTDGSAITGGPSGYTEAGTSDGTSIDYRVDYKLLDAAAEDPSTYTATGVEQTVSIMIRGGGTVGWGSIPEGGGIDTEAPWEGGNTYVTSGDDAAFTVFDGSGAISLLDDGVSGTAELVSDAPDDPSDEPWGPWADGDAEFLVKWKVDPIGNTSDSDSNLLTFTVYDGQARCWLYINLGDNINWAYMDPDQQRGIVLASGTSSFSDFYPFAMASDTWYYTRWDFRGATMRAKIWAASNPEPVDWPISLTKVAEDLDEESIFVIKYYGQSGDIAYFDSIDATLSGSGVGTLAPGDGASTTWAIDPWTPGSLRVFVDGIQVIPASFDREAGTFTFDRAPDLGAVIRVEYTPA